MPTQWTTWFACLGLLWLGQAQAADSAPWTWTTSERAWVEQVQELFRKQGLTFSDEQAQQAINAIRSRQLIPVAVEPAAPSISTPPVVVASPPAVATPPIVTPPAVEATTPVTTPTPNPAPVAVTPPPPPPAPAITAAPPPVITPVAAPSLPDKVFTEVELADQLKKWPTTTQNIELSHSAQGLKIDGLLFSDPEGPIVNSAADVMNASLGYLVERPDGYLLKLKQLGSDAPPLLLGRARLNSDFRWEVTTVTGKKLSGKTLTMLPSGFMLVSEQGAFYYVPGRGVSPIVIPRGYWATPLQPGNPTSSGLVLLEKIPDDSSQASRGLRALGESLGINREPSFALLNIETGKLFGLKLSVDHEQYISLRHCPQQASRECSQASFDKQRYNSQGQKLNGHYYWKLNWFNTPFGPLMVSLENANRDVLVTDLFSGEQVSAFNRVLGWPSFEAYQNKEGTVSLTVDGQHITNVLGYFARYQKPQ